MQQSVADALSGMPELTVKKLQLLLDSYAQRGVQVPGTVVVFDSVLGRNTLRYATVESLQQALKFLQDNEHNQVYIDFFRERGLEPNARATELAEQNKMRMRMLQAQSAAAAARAGGDFAITPPKPTKPVKPRSAVKTEEEDEDEEDGGSPQKPGTTGGGGGEDSNAKAQRKRVAKTPAQLAELEASFGKNPEPSDVERRAIADRIGLEFFQVSAWFTARRRKARGYPLGADPSSLAGAGGSGGAGTPMLTSGVGLGGGGAGAYRLVKIRMPEATLQRRQELELEILRQAKARLPEPFREDGPPLAMYFDHVSKLPLAIARANATGDESEDDENDLLLEPPERSRRRADRELQKARRSEDQQKKDKRREEQQRARLMARLEKEREREEDKRKRAAEREAKRIEDQKAKQEKAKQEPVKRSRPARPAPQEEVMEIAERSRRYLVEDDDLEWAQLCAQWRVQGRLPHAAHPPASAIKQDPEAPGDTAGTEAPAPPAAVPDPSEEECAALGLERPAFPPPEVRRRPAFEDAQRHYGLDEASCTSALALWQFVHSFGDLLGATPFAPEELMEALREGEASQLLSEVACSLMHYLLGEMEESHANGGMMILAASIEKGADRSPLQFAQLLETAWAWGFDPDSWRADLDLITWPEVLRQFAIVLGYGRRKMNMFRSEAYVGPPYGSAALLGGGGGAGGGAGGGGGSKKNTLGGENEDVESWDEQTGAPRVKVPARFVPGSMKFGAWTVLSKSGAKGLSCADIAKKMDAQGLKDFKGIKNPPTNVHSGLINDVVFTKVGPAQYALTSYVNFHKLKTGEDLRFQGEEKGGGERKDGKPAAADTCEYVPPTSEPNAQAEAWVDALERGPFSELSMADRLRALSILVDQCVDSPSLRAAVEHRVEEGARLRRHVQEEGRRDKRKRLEDGNMRGRMLQLTQHEKRQRTAAAGGAGTGGAGASPLNQQLPQPGDAEEAKPDVGAGPTPAKEPSAPPATPLDKPLPGPAELYSRESFHVRGCLPPGHVPEELQSIAFTSGVPDALLPGPGPVPAAPAGGNQPPQEEALRTLLRNETTLTVDLYAGVRGEPLGYDRRHNRYWRCSVGSTLHSSLPASCDAYRIYLEDTSGHWTLLQSWADVQRLTELLNRKGLREAELLANLKALAPPAAFAAAEDVLPLGVDPQAVRKARAAAVTRQTDALVAAVQHAAGDAEEFEVFAVSVEAQEAEEQAAAWDETIDWVDAKGLDADRFSKKGRVSVRDPLEETPAAASSSSASETDDWTALGLARLKRDLLVIVDALLPEMVLDAGALPALSASVRAAASLPQIRDCLARLEALIRVEFIHFDFQTIAGFPYLVQGAFANVATGYLRAPFLKRKAFLHSGLYGDLVPVAAQLGLIAPPQGVVAKGPGRPKTAAADPSNIPLSDEEDEMGDDDPTPAAAAGPSSVASEASRFLHEQPEKLMVWLPATLPSLVLRVRALDAALIYRPGLKARREMSEIHNFIRKPVHVVPWTELHGTHYRRAAPFRQFRKRPIDKRNYQQELDVAAQAAARATMAGVPLPPPPPPGMAAARGGGASAPGGAGAGGKKPILPSYGDLAALPEHDGTYGTHFPVVPDDLSSRPVQGFYLPVVDYKRWMRDQVDVTLLAALMPEGTLDPTALTKKRSRAKKPAAGGGEAARAVSLDPQLFGEEPVEGEGPAKKSRPTPPGEGAGRGGRMGGGGRGAGRGRGRGRLPEPEPESIVYIDEDELFEQALLEQGQANPGDAPVEISDVSDSDEDE